MRYEYRAKVTRVVDGDTIDLEVDLGLRVLTRARFRIYGVDTPETFGEKRESAEYAAGMRAKRATEAFLHNAADDAGWLVIRTHKDRTGKYGRWLADVYDQDGSTMLSEHLIVGGFAEPATY